MTDALIERLEAEKIGGISKTAGIVNGTLDKAIEIIRQHQGTRVSLKKCSDALAHSRYGSAYDTMEQFHHECCSRDAKAVLEAAGVPYVD